MKAQEDEFSLSQSGSTYSHDPNFSIGNMESKLHQTFARSLCNPSPIHIHMTSSINENPVSKMTNGSSLTESSSVSLESTSSLNSNTSKDSKSSNAVNNENTEKRNSDKREDLNVKMYDKNIRTGNEFVYSEMEDLYMPLDELCDESSMHYPYPPLCITGPSGGGKSALLSNWVVRRVQSRSKISDSSNTSGGDGSQSSEMANSMGYAANEMAINNKGCGEFIFSHVAGCNRLSCSIFHTLRRLLVELKSFFDLTKDIPANNDRLPWELPYFLELAGKKGRVIIILDGIHRLRDGDSSTNFDLNWLPVSLPPNVRIIVTCTLYSVIAPLPFEDNVTLPNPCMDIVEEEGAVEEKTVQHFNLSQEKDNTSQNIRHRVLVNDYDYISRIEYGAKSGNGEIIGGNPLQSMGTSIEIASNTRSTNIHHQSISPGASYSTNSDRSQPIFYSANSKDKLNKALLECKRRKWDILHIGNLSQKCKRDIITSYLKYTHTLPTPYAPVSLGGKPCINPHIPKGLSSGTGGTEENSNQGQILNGVNGLLLFPSLQKSIISSSASKRPLYLRLLLRVIHYSALQGYEIFSLVEELLKANNVIELYERILFLWESGNSVPTHLLSAMKDSENSSQADSVAKYVASCIEKANEEGGYPVLLKKHPWIKVQKEANEDVDEYNLDDVEDQKETDLKQALNELPHDDDSDTEEDEGEKLPQETLMMNKVTETTKQNITRARKDIRKKVEKLIASGKNTLTSPRDIDGIEEESHDSSTIDTQDLKIYDPEKPDNINGSYDHYKKKAMVDFYVNQNTSSENTLKNSMGNFEAEAFKKVNHAQVNAKQIKEDDYDEDNFESEEYADDGFENDEKVEDEDENNDNQKRVSIDVKELFESSKSTVSASSTSIAVKSKTNESEKGLDGSSKGSIADDNMKNREFSASSVIISTTKTITTTHAVTTTTTDENGTSKSHTKSLINTTSTSCTSVLQSKDMIDLLPFYYKGGCNVDGLGSLLGNALSLLYVARHGLTVQELHIILTSMKNNVDQKLFEKIYKNRNNLLRAFEYLDEEQRGVLNMADIVPVLGKLDNKLKKSKLEKFVGDAGVFIGNTKMVDYVKFLDYCTNELVTEDMEELGFLPDEEEDILDDEDLANINANVNNAGYLTLPLSPLKDYSVSVSNDSFIATTSCATSEQKDIAPVDVNKNANSMHSAVNHGPRKKKQNKNEAITALLPQLLEMLKCLGIIYLPSNEVLIMSMESEALRTVIYQRYIRDARGELKWHNALMAYFQGQKSSLRRCEELPWHLQICRRWSNLKDVLVDLWALELMYTGPLKQELFEYWRILTEGPLYLPEHQGDPNEKQKTDAAQINPTGDNSLLLSELDVSSVLGYSDSKAAEEKLRGQQQAYDIVECYNASVEHWHIYTRPNATKVSYIIRLIALFLADFGQSVHFTKSFPSFLRKPLLSPTLSAIGVDEKRFHHLLLQQQQINSDSADVSDTSYNYNDPANGDNLQRYEPSVTRSLLMSNDEIKLQNKPGDHMSLSDDSFDENKATSLKNIPKMVPKSNGKKWNEPDYYFLRWMWIQFPWIALSNTDLAIKMYGDLAANRRKQAEKLQALGMLALKGEEASNPNTNMMTTESKMKKAPSSFETFQRMWNVKKMDPRCNDKGEALDGHIMKARVKGYLQNIHIASDNSSRVIRDVTQNKLDISFKNKQNKFDPAPILPPISQKKEGETEDSTIITKQTNKIINGVDVDSLLESVAKMTNNIKEELASRSLLAAANREKEKDIEIRKKAQIEKNSKICHNVEGLPTGYIPFSYSSQKSLRSGTRVPAVEAHYKRSLAEKESEMDAVTAKAIARFGGMEPPHSMKDLMEEVNANCVITGVPGMSSLPAHQYILPMTVNEIDFADALNKVCTLRHHVDRMKEERRRMQARLTDLRRAASERNSQDAIVVEKIETGEYVIQELKSRITRMSATLKEAIAVGKFYSLIQEMINKNPARDNRRLDTLEQQLQLASAQCRDLLKERHRLYLEKESCEKEELIKAKIQLKKARKDRINCSKKMEPLIDSLKARIKKEFIKGVESKGQAVMKGIFKNSMAEKSGAPEIVGTNTVQSVNRRSPKKDQRNLCDEIPLSEAQNQIETLKALMHIEEPFTLVSKYQKTLELRETLEKQRIDGEHTIQVLKNELYRLQAKAKGAYGDDETDSTSANDPAKSGQEGSSIADTIFKEEMRVMRASRSAFTSEQFLDGVKNGINHLSRIVARASHTLPIIALRPTKNKEFKEVFENEEVPKILALTDERLTAMKEELTLEANDNMTSQNDKSLDKRKDITDEESIELMNVTTILKKRNVHLSKNLHITDDYDDSVHTTSTDELTETSTADQTIDKVKRLEQMKTIRATSGIRVIPSFQKDHLYNEKTKKILQEEDLNADRLDIKVEGSVMSVDDIGTENFIRGALVEGIDTQMELRRMVIVELDTYCRKYLDDDEGLGISFEGALKALKLPEGKVWGAGGVDGPGSMCAMSKEAKDAIKDLMKEQKTGTGFPRAETINRVTDATKNQPEKIRKGQSNSKALSTGMTNTKQGPVPMEPVYHIQIEGEPESDRTAIKSSSSSYMNKRKKLLQKNTANATKEEGGASTSNKVKGA